MRYVFSTTDTTVYRFPTHVNELVLDRSESTVTEVFIVVLEPGEAPPLHKHPGHRAGLLHPAAGRRRAARRAEGGAERYRVKPGDVVRIPPDTWHMIDNDGVRRHSLRQRRCLPRRAAGGRTDLGRPRARHLRGAGLGLSPASSARASAQGRGRHDRQRAHPGRVQRGPRRLRPVRAQHLPVVLLPSLPRHAARGTRGRDAPVRRAAPPGRRHPGPVGHAVGGQRGLPARASTGRSSWTRGACRPRRCRPACRRPPRSTSTRPARTSTGIASSRRTAR